MKKIFYILIIGVILFAINGCGKKQKELYIYNWSYYIPEEVIADFEKEYNIKITYDVFSSNEEMYAKLKAGATGYDMIFPSGDFVSLLIKEEMVEKLDKSKITNFGYIDKNILQKIRFDPSNQYSVPYMMGATGIAVNKKYVKNYSKDYSIYEMEEYKGKMTMLDDMREVLGNALADLGYSVNSTNEIELEQAKEKAKKWKKNIVKYDAESFAKGFAAEEFWVVQCYAENVFLEVSEEMKKDIEFFIPEKGGTMYIDNMLILKDAKNKDAAYKFINYIHRPKVYAKICDWLSLPSINVEARKYTEEATNYTIDDMKNCEFIMDIGNNVNKYNEIWQELIIE